MTFKTIAFKNFKCQLRKYMAYFLCSSFSIMIFFMYSTLLFNDKINNMPGFKLIFTTGMLTVTVFSIFFVNYAHSAFIKTRHKEFALYMTLGMSQKDIRRIVLIENLFIIVSSLVTGLLTGIIFSRFFQIIAMKLLNVEGVSYSLSYKSFTWTIAVFAAIFLFVIIISRLSTRKLEISELFTKARKSDSSGRYSLVLGLTGVFAIILSCFFLYYSYQHPESDMLPMIYFLIVLPGMYLAIANLGNAVLGFYKSKSSLYHRNILLTTELKYKFNQNKKILFVLSILSFVIINYTGMTFAMYSMSEGMAEELQPNHLEYLQLGKINALEKKIVQKIVMNAGTPVILQKAYEFISLKIKGDNDENDLLKSKSAVSEKTYNNATHQKLKIAKGQVVAVMIPGAPTMLTKRAPLGKIEVELGKNTFGLNTTKVIDADWISGLPLYPSSAGLVLNDEDYGYLKSQLQSDSIGTYHSFNFKDWEKTKKTVEELRTALVTFNNTSSEKIDSTLFGVSSRIGFYENFKHNYAIAIFVLSITALLFFIAAGSVLYFKHFSEIAAMKEKFFKIYKIGITEKEISSVISKELKLIFFVPLIFGIVPGYSMICYSCSRLGGEKIIMKLMFSATVVVIAYFIFQGIFYMAIRKKYTSEIIEDMLN